MGHVAPGLFLQWTWFKIFHFLFLIFNQVYSERCIQLSLVNNKALLYARHYAWCWVTNMTETIYSSSEAHAPVETIVIITTITNGGTTFWASVRCHALCLRYFIHLILPMRMQGIHSLSIFNRWGDSSSVRTSCLLKMTDNKW